MSNTWFEIPVIRLLVLQTIGDRNMFNFPKSYFLIFSVLSASVQPSLAEPAKIDLTTVEIRQLRPIARMDLAFNAVCAERKCRPAFEACMDSARERGKSHSEAEKKM